MDGDLLSPAQLTARLGVTDRTVRRLSVAYRNVYGDLPINPRRPNGQGRVFPPEAVGRIEQAHRLMSDRAGLSAVEALEALRDGRSLPARAGGNQLQPDALLPVLTELSALRQEVAALREVVLSLQPTPPMTEAPLQEVLQLPSSGSVSRAEADARPDTLSVTAQLPRHRVDPRPTGFPSLGQLLRRRSEPRQMTEAHAQFLAERGMDLEFPQLRANEGKSPDGAAVSLDGGSVLRVIATQLPQRLKNQLRWKPSAYAALEELLSRTQFVSLHRTNGKDTWRTDGGVTMRKDTVRHLLLAEVLQGESI